MELYDSRESAVKRSLRSARDQLRCLSSVLFSLTLSFSHQHNMVEHCRLCCAHTLSDARFSPRVCGARTFHEGFNQPLYAAVVMSNASRRTPAADSIAASKAGIGLGFGLVGRST